MDFNSLLPGKIGFPEYATLIARCYPAFSGPEQALLTDILRAFDFDAVEAQALAQAVLLQSRFDPNAQHLSSDDDDEDVTGICPHCLNPPVPPLRDYWQWRKQKQNP